MRTTILSSLLSLCLCLAACSGGDQIKVGGKSLSVQDSTYSVADYYCGTLANGQYIVLLTDFLLCDAVHQNLTNREIFHGSIEETNLRLIFPSTLKKNPAINTFKVGQSNCIDTNTEGTQAIAYFSHNGEAQATYDLNLMADSGTISVTYRDANVSELVGSFDLMFGADHAKGDFKALFCNTEALGTGIGN